MAMVIVLFFSTFYQVNLSWNASPGVEVYRKLPEAKTWNLKASNVSAQTWTDDDVGFGKTYNYEVCNSTGCSNVVVVTIPAS